MEVVIPGPAMDFDFNSARSSPRSTAPSTPTEVGGGCFFSAPTSPTRLFEFYRGFDSFSMMSDRQSSRRSNSLAAIPFDWEEKPGTPKSPRREEGDGFAFAFAFSEALEKTSLPAEDLFDGGKIKPLKPPPRLQVQDYNYNQKNPLLSSPRSPKSPLSQGKKFIRHAFSPRKKTDRDPFATAIETSRNQTDDHTRVRERVQDLSKNSSRRAIRSLSPYRVSAYPWEEEEEEERKRKQNESTSSNKPSTCSNKGPARKWRLRDIFLFRSASEGHATYKDRFWWYSTNFFKKPEDNKNSSSKSRDVSSGSDGSGIKASENNNNNKKKPCKQGILGRLAFSPVF